MKYAYNKHYVSIDSMSRILDGWSDGPNPEKRTADAVCINNQGGYQFHLEGEENPKLYTVDGIPLYKLCGKHAVKRTQAEIEMDRATLPMPEPAPTQLDRIEAQATYTAMMTDTLLQEV